MAGMTYWKALDKIARAGEFNQYAIIKALRPTATDPVIQSNLNGARKLWESHTKVVGNREIVNLGADLPTKMGKDVMSVQVHFCVNQDTRRVSTKTGKQVGKAYPAHLQTDYEMRTVKGVFKVYQATTKGVASC